MAAQEERGARSARDSLKRIDIAGLLAVAILVVLLVELAYDRGGYFPSEFLMTGYVAFVALAVLLAVRLRRWSPSGEALAAVAALTALGAWTGLSATWSPLPDEAYIGFERALFYVALLGLAVVSAGSGRSAGALPWGALTVCVVVVGGGVLSRLRPDLVESTAGVIGGYRLSHPFGYWNALGGMAAFGTVLALGLAADPSARRVSRGLAASATTLLAAGLWLSLSRGAWLALILGLVALVALGAHRWSLLAVGVVCGTAAALAVLRLDALPGLVDAPTAGDGQEHEGRRFLPLMVLLAGGAGALVALMGTPDRWRPQVDSLKRMSRLPVAGLALLGCLAALVGYAVFSGAVEGRSAQAIEDTSDWFSRQWDDFLDASTAPAQEGSRRLTSARGTRSDLYRVAINGFEDDWLKGDGGGAYEARWLRERDVEEDVQDAHSLGLETLGELGLVGGLLLLAFLGAVVRAAVRGRSGRGAMRRSQAAACGAAFITWTLHAMVDWDWQMPALTGTAMLLAAAVLPVGTTRRRRRATAATYAGTTAPRRR